MAETREYGLIRLSGNGEFQLVSTSAAIEGMRIVRVAPEFASRQAQLFADYHEFQTILHDHWDGLHDH